MAGIICIQRLLVWRMQCVGFDEAFLADLMSKI